MVTTRSVQAFCGATLLLVLTCRAAFAQPDPQTLALKRLSLEELGNIEVISVSKVPEAVWNTAAAIYVLTQADIARSGATSIPDVLRLVPGVEVARIDTSRNWVVGIRGFGDQFSKSVLVLIDGRSTYTPLWAGVHWPIQDTLLEDIERIEVIRGPGGTIWGANAQNGVINIITKPARNTRGFYASGAAGNVDEALGGFRYGGGTGNLNYRAYVKGTNRAPQFHSDGRDYDTWAMGQAGFRVDWDRGGDELTITGDAYTAELGESIRVATFAPPASFLVTDPVDLYGFNVLANWRRILRPGSALRVQAYADHTYRLGTDFGERRTTIDLDAMEERLHRPEYEAVRQSLNDIGMQTTIDLFSTYAGSAEDLRPWLQDAEINRDRNLRLQYLAGRGLNLYKADLIYAEMLPYAKDPVGTFKGSDPLMQSLLYKMHTAMGR